MATQVREQTIQPSSPIEQVRDMAAKTIALNYDAVMSKLLSITYGGAH